jgi:hypothetical protein
MSTTKAFEARVREVLLQSWDPIGIAGIAAAQDEYDQYVKPIAAMIIRGAATDELSRHLLEIETNHMSLKGDRARAHSAAGKLPAIVCTP